jgi:hypothetical protein
MDKIGLGIWDKHPGSAILGESDKHSLIYSRNNAQEVVSLRHPKITFIAHPMKRQQQTL